MPIGEVSMISPAMIYFIGMLDKIENTLLGIVALCSVLIFISAFLWAAIDDEGGSPEIARRFCFGSIASFVLFIILYAFTPSTKLAAAMFIVPAVANNENVQAIGSNSLEALRKLTEQWLRELDGSKPQGKESKL